MQMSLLVAAQTLHRLLPRLLWLTSLLLAAPACAAQASTEELSLDEFEDFDAVSSFDDRPLVEPLTHPDWFKLSFLDLREDLREAQQNGKRGLAVYFGQKYCAYCKALLEGNYGKLDILAYTQKHFDVIGIDIHGQRTVTDLDGFELPENEFSRQLGIHFTPTMIFYTSDGEEALRLPGYYPPYKYRAALEFVADDHFRRETFRSYLERADVGTVFEAGGLNEEEFFLQGPLALDRSRRAGERPLAVFFEQADCHACDVLHTGPLRDSEVRSLLYQLESVQIDMWSENPVITPRGERTRANAWASDLGLFYTPTLIFFDQQGHEILRVDSVVQFFRLRGVLEFVASGAYREFDTFQAWRAERRNQRQEPLSKADPAFD